MPARAGLMATARHVGASRGGTRQGGASLPGVGQAGAGQIGGLFDETETERATRLLEERRRVAASIRSVEEQRVVPLAAIQAWADSLGTENVLPLPRARRWSDRVDGVEGTSLADEAAESLGHIDWWYSRPGEEKAARRRVVTLLTAIGRLASNAEMGLPSDIPGTRVLMCQGHRIVYVVRPGQPPDHAGVVVVFDIFGLPQP